MMVSNKGKIILAPGIAVLAAAVILLGSWLFFAVSQGSAQTGDENFYDVREIETTDLGVPNPAGLAYSPAAGVLLVADNQEKGKPNLDVSMISLIERLEGTSRVTSNNTDFLANMAYNSRDNSLYLLSQAEQELDQVPVKQNGELASTAPVSASFDVEAYGLGHAEGMAFDPNDGRLFLLDPTGHQLVIVTPDENGSYEGDRAAKQGRIERVNLNHLGAKHLRGIAYNPANAHLYLLDADGQNLYEIDDGGQLFNTLDVSPFDLRDPQGMVFAPSGDLTDDPEIMDLYLADSGEGSNPRPGRIMEFALPLP